MVTGGSSMIITPCRISRKEPTRTRTMALPPSGNAPRIGVTATWRRSIKWPSRGECSQPWTRKGPWMDLKNVSPSNEYEHLYIYTKYECWCSRFATTHQLPFLGGGLYIHITCAHAMFVLADPKMWVAQQMVPVCGIPAHVTSGTNWHVMYTVTHSCTCTQTRKISYDLLRMYVVIDGWMYKYVLVHVYTHKMCVGVHVCVQILLTSKHGRFMDGSRA